MRNITRLHVRDVGKIEVTDDAQEIVKELANTDVKFITVHTEEMTSLANMDDGVEFETQTKEKTIRKSDIIMVE